MTHTTTKEAVFSTFSTQPAHVAYLGCVQAVHAGGWVMVCVVEVLCSEELIVVGAAGVVAAGAGHGLLRPSNCQLTEGLLQTALTPLPTVRAGLQSAQTWGQQHRTEVHVDL